MGELVPGRRAAFWASLGAPAQIVATGTEIPASEKLDPRFTVVNIEDLLVTDTLLSPQPAEHE